MKFYSNKFLILAIVLIIGAIILYTLAEISIEGMESTTPTLHACVDEVYNTPAKCEYVKGTSPTTIGIINLTIPATVMDCPPVKGNPTFTPGFTVGQGSSPDICNYSSVNV